ncbi:tRNA pseudouridine synthase, putative [Plasmodium knowlesi strain H]|uniref:tRNA pseudouridine(55) synthase n=5 Tax=Plasmodium knowlesi TaxID=5850 RepID=A0A5K1VU04_PLAKH|nr:tRNA pseudouridine synthase, putative [Plasmodium knowlesi strain H]CAA9987072.1 tRNA pseudouridine synthase, putative [Plasmodium knowlesi strain H]SBO23798.1 tRNA pseudouridine synthase, putative [Plasmodium knowlesi strain H]SBO25537.1 tRNA pseudouridine synthase, putative [Plasmodium knowlesi strain H]VVS76546.1 tRNA pseudouridine synthase, putative [Plasmodium knowlesi strain H]|eukprot:XP_002261695.1 trna pseudouridine synthase, putative [Plasmodium knowlesi strain H]
MCRAPLALRLCLLCALLPLFVRPGGKRNSPQKIYLVKAIHRKDNRPPNRRIHLLAEPPPSLQTFYHPHNRGNRTKLFYLSPATKKFGKLRIVLRRVRCNDTEASKKESQVKEGVNLPKSGVQMDGEKDALKGSSNRANCTGKMNPCEKEGRKEDSKEHSKEHSKEESKSLQSATTPMDQPNSIDFYVTLYKDNLLKRPSKIMDMSPPRQNEQTERKKKKKEATLDDILYGGLLNIYKPVNTYSMKVCERVKGVLKEHFKHVCKMNLNFKVGHGGTLDPFAEGVLVIGIQKGTKKLSDFLKCYKKYLALGLFGLETDTLDREGNVVKISNEMMKGKIPQTGTNTHDTLTLKKNIIHTLNRLIGHVYQTPPLYSAKRVHGMRLYEYARKKIPVHIKPSKVHIQNLKYLNQVDLPFFDLDIKCSGGTYIRSLVRDFAHELNTHATLIKLIRIQQGEQFLYEHSLHYDDINMENIKRHLIKL